MKCEKINLPDGSGVIVCRSGGGSGKKCKCGRRATKLCDWLVANTLGGGTMTCDEPLCDSCARRIGEDKDFCPKHYEALVATRKEEKK